MKENRRAFSPMGMIEKNKEDLTNKNEKLTLKERRKLNRKMFSNDRCNSRIKEKSNCNEMLPEILKEKKEIKVYEELQKGSEKLRQEATLNLQRYGGNFIPDFYGGKARMRFGCNEDQVGTHQEMCQTFCDDSRSKWNFIAEYVTNKSSNNQIVTNVINECNNSKIRSLEKLTAREQKKICRKKESKACKLPRGISKPFDSEMVHQTPRESPVKLPNHPLSSRNILNGIDLNESIVKARECMSKSPLGFAPPLSEDRFFPKQFQSKTKSKKKGLETELEDYDTFYKKEILPKELRNINPNLLKLIPHCNNENLKFILEKKFDVNREVTEEEKRLIDMKYDLKKLNTINNKEMINIQRLKTTHGTKNSPSKRMKTFLSDNNIEKTSDTDIATKSDSITKGSTSPKKNERYSKAIANDDEIDEYKMQEFQKALSLPIEMNKTLDVNLDSSKNTQNEAYFSGIINEMEEDHNSSNDSDNFIDNELKLIAQK